MFIKSSLRRDTFFLTFTKLVTMVINMLCVMLLSRFRTLEEYGTYSQLILVTTLMSTLMSVGLPNSITYFLKKTEDSKDKKKFVSHYYIITLVISIFLGLAVFFFRGFIGRYYNNSAVTNYGFFLLLYPFTIITAESLNYLLVSYKKTALLVVYQLIRSVALILDVIVINVVDGSFFDYMMVLIIIEILYSIMVYVTAFVIVKGFSFKLSIPYLWSILKFSLPIGLAYALGTITSYLDKIMISHWFSTEDYAVYANAAKELPIAFIAFATAGALMPRIVQMLTKKENSSAYSIWKSTLEFNFIILSLMVFGLICFSREAIVFLYSDKYLSGRVVFCIYTGIVLLRSAQFGMLLIAKGKTKKIFYVSVIVLALNVILNFVFIKLFGFVGPAIATAIVSILEIVLILGFTKREFNVCIKELIPFKTIISVVIASFSFALVFSKFKDCLPLDRYIGSVFESVILGLVWALIYLFVFRKKLIECWKKMGVD